MDEYEGENYRVKIWAFVICTTCCIFGSIMGIGAYFTYSNNVRKMPLHYVCDVYKILAPCVYTTSSIHIPQYTTNVQYIGNVCTILIYCVLNVYTLCMQYVHNTCTMCVQYLYNVCTCT